MPMTRQWGYTLLLVALGGCADSRPMPLAPSSESGVGASVGTDWGHGRPELTATGRYHVVVPPSVFGTMQPIRAEFRFDARKKSDGTVSGHYYVEQYVDGTTNHYRGAFTCFGDYDLNGLTGNRAKIGGVLTESDDPTSPVGSYLWWQAIDNDHSPTPTPNQSTLAGGGDNAANEAFCGSDKPPVFGPFDAHGKLEVEQH